MALILSRTRLGGRKRETYEQCFVLLSAVLPFVGSAPILLAYSRNKNRGANSERSWMGCCLKNTAFSEGTWSHMKRNRFSSKTINSGTRQGTGPSLLSGPNKSPPQFLHLFPFQFQIENYNALFNSIKQLLLFKHLKPIGIFVRKFLFV